MDPTVTLEWLILAARDGDPVRLLEAAEDLIGWLQKDGFPPDFDKLRVWVAKEFEYGN